MLCRTLHHFNSSSDEYSVVFVSNCTAAVKLVAESFKFIEPRSCIVCDGTSAVTAADGTAPASNVEEFRCTKCPHDADIFHRDKHLYNELKAVSDVKTENCMNSTDVDDDEDEDDDVGDVVCKLSKPPVSCCMWNGEPITKPTLLYTDDNHTSVIGMRRVIARHGAEFCCIHADNVDAFLLSLQQSSVSPSSSQFVAQKHSHDTVNNAATAAGDAMKRSSSHLMAQKHCCYTVNSLFAYPAQSNFSGCRYPLDWVDTIHRRSDRESRMRSCCESKMRPRWYVLLDAAALLTTSTLDLRQHKPDFVALSFYKMFGFPTGLGTSLSCCVCSADVM